MLYGVICQVSALSLDPSGARLVSGGYEYDVKFWDFAGMDSSLRSFRTITPCERCTLLLLLIVAALEHIGLNCYTAVNLFEEPSLKQPSLCFAVCSLFCPCFCMF